MKCSQMVLQTVRVLAEFAAVWTLDWWGVAMLILHVSRYGVLVDEFTADLTLNFIGI